MKQRTHNNRMTNTEYGIINQQQQQQQKQKQMTRSTFSIPKRTKTSHVPKATNKMTTTRINEHRKIRNSWENQSQSEGKFQNNCCDIAVIYRPSSKQLLSSMPMNKTARNHRLSSNTFRSWLYFMPYFLAFLLLPTADLVNAAEYKSHSEMSLAASLSASASAKSPQPPTRYSQQFTADNIRSSSSSASDDGFRPIIPKNINLENISRNVFTQAGQYRVFEDVESDLRATLSKQSGEEVPTPTPQATPSMGNVGQEKGMVTSQSKIKTLKKEDKMEEEQQQKDSFTEYLKQANEEPHNPMTMKSPTQQRKRQTQGTKDEEQKNPRVHRQQISSGAAVAAMTPKKPPEGTFEESLASEMKGLENLLAEYVDNFFNKGQYQPKPELIIALQQNHTDMKQQYERRVASHFPAVENLPRAMRQVATERSAGQLSFNIPRVFESGRLLFFAGLKKVMWPIYMGLQILKSLMFALLLPTLIGSFGKLLGKGITSGSAPLFIRPMDEPQEVDFKDNHFNFDDDSNKFMLMDDGVGSTKDNGYAYNQAEASQTHNQYAYNAALSQYGMNDRQQLMQDSYLSALQSLGAASFKNSNSLSSGSSGSLGGNGLAGLTAPMRQKPAAAANVDTFQQFQKVPASSLLLSNYDPFYSPLLSRLDSVFAQLKLNSDNEACREKLICLMYANPAKYAPYSNLVSAQLSRELNELRKPTSDNPDILRFFKYMRAAKDGQDGIDCEKSFEKCKEFKDFENPAMVSTYHDINKLVQARKFT